MLKTIPHNIQTTIFLMLLLALGGCDNDTEIDVTEIIDDLSSQQLVDGTVLGLKRGITDNLNLAQQLITSADIFKETAALLSQPQAKSANARLLPKLASGFLSSTGIDLSLLAEVPQLTEMIVRHSTVTARDNNRFSLDPKESTICSKLDIDAQKQAQCIEIIQPIQLDVIVKALENNTVTAAQVTLNYNNDLVLFSDFTAEKASIDLHLPGVKTALKNIADIAAPGELNQVPSTMLGSLRLEIAQTPENLAMTLAISEPIDISNASIILPVKLNLPASDNVLSFNLDYQTLLLETAFSEIQFIGFDSDENGIFPVSLTTNSKITGSALFQEFGRKIILRNIGIKDLSFSIDGQPALSFSLDNFDATVEQNPNQRPTIEFNSGSQLSLTINNHRGYFSDLFESDNPDLRRELNVNIDSATHISRVSKRIVKIDTGSVIAGLSIDHQDPLAFEITGGSCFDLEGLELISCPLFTIKDQGIISPSLSF